MGCSWWVPGRQGWRQSTTAVVRCRPLKWRHNEHDGVSNTSITIFYTTVCLGAEQRKHQSSASLVFVRGIHWWPVNSPHKWPVTRKMFPFDDGVMTIVVQRDACCAVFCSVTQYNATQYENTIQYNEYEIPNSIWSQSIQQGKSEGFDSCDRPSNLTQIGYKSSIFQPVWPWNLMDDPKNNRAPLLCYFKLCASFRSHWWIQTGVTVRKRLIWVKIDDFF